MQRRKSPVTSSSLSLSRGRIIVYQIHFSAFSSVVLKASRDMPHVSSFRQIFHNLLYFTVRNLFLRFDLNFSLLKYIPFALDLLP